MSKKAILYGLLSLLFAFTAAVFYFHFSEIPTRIADTKYDFRVPFAVDGVVAYVSPAAGEAGLNLRDKVLTVNGRDAEAAFKDEIEKGRVNGGNLELTVQRGPENQVLSLAVPMLKVERNAGYYFRLMASYLYSFGLPLLCALLGFWVVLARPTDYVAWLLLFLLLGVATFGLEGFGQPRVITSFRNIFSGTWSLSMLLFGIYFPERFVLDRKAPWLKWILIVPLSYQVLAILVDQIRVYTGFDLFGPVASVNSMLFRYLFFLNFLAIGFFFAILGWKSGTLESPDARRRLRVMYAGTSIGITPFFGLILYKIFSGAQGSFYDVAPGWVAFLALVLTLLFPLTMAYVIVVNRAMDVSVVIRQGLQYALAKGGIRVIQFLMLLMIGLLVRWSINNYGTSLLLQIAIIVGGISLVPLIDVVARPVRTWIDRRFFREAYNADQILSDLSEDVRTMVETKPLLETVAGKISESLHVPQVSLLLKNESSFVPAYSIGFDASPKVSLTEDSRAIRKLRDNKHIVLYDDMTEITSVPTMSLDEREQLREMNTQILLPIAAKNELSGILSLSPKQSEEPYTASDLRLLKSVATQTGFALENSRLTAAVAKEAAQKERLNAELEIAREVQERLFPQEFPNVDGLEYYGHCRPALGVGGDYYDFIELQDGKFGFAIGDVSGKGIGASLMMASLQASLRGQAIHSGDDLSSLMSNVNRLVYEASTTNRYATFFYAQYEANTRMLTYVNAGHNPPYLLRGGQDEPILLTDGGPVVGMLPPMLVKYSQGEIQLKPGDLIVGFTDGISEAMNPKDEEWGEEALLAKLQTILDKSPTEIHDACVAGADAFANGAKQHDDMTMIAVRVL